MVNSMDILKAESINFGYGSHKILENVNFEMNNEQVIGLFGDSGSGKSTLCKILTGFIKDYEGNVTVPSNVNHAIHTIIADYNNEETINAVREKREPLILPDISAHNLRHTFCTRLWENETNLKVIQSIMGHKDIQTTMDIYADCTEDKKKEVIKNMEDKIFVI